MANSDVFNATTLRHSVRPSVQPTVKSAKHVIRRPIKWYNSVSCVFFLHVVSRVVVVGLVAVVAASASVATDTDW